MRSLLAIALCILAPAVPASESAKTAGRAFVQDVKEAGKEVGRASAKLGREVARASTQAAREVRRVTADHWDRALAAKRRKVAELQKENRELKKSKRER